MKIKFLLLALLVTLLAMPVCAQEPTQNLQQGTAATAAPAEEAVPAGPMMEILRDVIGLSVLKDGRMVQTEDEKIKVLSTQGAKKYSQVIRFFTSGQQKINIAYAKVIKKNGEEISILSNPEAVTAQDVEILKESPLYKPLRMLILNFGKLEPEDVIEYRIETEDLTVQPLKAFWLTSMSQDSGPIKETKVELSFPQGTEFNYKTVRQPNEKAAFVKKTKDSRDNYTLSLKNVPPAPNEIVMPPLSSITSKVVVSNMSSWDQLAQFMNASIIGKTEPSEKMMKDIKGLESESTKKDLVGKIYKLVKDSKKVLAVGFGLGGYSFHKAADIYEQPVITAADSALLLYSLYKAAGIDAHLVLASSVEMGRVSKEIPSVQQFDDLIVAVKDGDKYTWIDTSFTAPFMGVMRAELQGCDAFIINETSGVFASTPAMPPYRNREDVCGELSLMIDGSADAVISLDFFGMNATSWMNLYSGLNDMQRQNIYMLLAKKIAPNVNILTKSLSLPNAENDPFSIYVRYISFGMVQKDKSGELICSMPILAGGDFRKFISADIDTRQTPVFIGTPCQEDRKFRILIPEGTAITKIPESRYIDNEIGTFQIECAMNEKGMYYQSRMVMKKSVVEKKDFDKLLEILEAVEKARTEKIVMTGFKLR